MIEKATLENLYKTNTIKAISLLLNTSPANVRRYVKIFDLKKPLRDKNKKAIDTEVVNSLYTQGKSILDIAKELNASYDCISSFINITDPKNSKYPTFKNLYSVQKKSVPEICESLNISPATVWRWAKRLNLQRHNPIDKTKLETLYVSQNLSIVKIAKRLKVPKEDVLVALKVNKIHKRRVYSQTLSKEQIQAVYPSLSLKEASDKLNLPSSRLIKLLGIYDIPLRNRGKIATSLDKEVLYDLYINQDKSKKEIAEILGVCAKVVGRQVNYYNLTKTPLRRTTLNIDKEELEDLFVLEGVEYIEEKYNVTKKAVKEALARNNILKLRADIKPIPRERLIDLYVNTYAMYKAPVAISEISRDLNLSKREIREYIRHHKIKR